MNDQLKQQFLTTIDEMLGKYTLARGQLEALHVNVKTSDWDEAIAMSIIEQLAELQRQGQAANQIFAQLPESLRKSSEIQGKLGSITSDMKSLLETINQLENTAKKSRDQRLPQINASVRAFQMQKAYSAQAIN
ncbi:MAG: hypothetical protein R3C03_15610 [Pirellulaceae bacterium]